MPRELKTPEKTSRPLKTALGTFLAPERLYTLRGFLRCAAMSRTRLMELERTVKLPRRRNGRGVWVDGADAIEWMKQVTERR
jgi:hypothetical protein